MKKHYLYPIISIGILFLMACTESFEDRCRREAREFTEKQCPRLVEEHIILDSMTYVEAPQGFIYHYRVTGELDNPELLTADALEPIIENMRQNLRQNLSLRAYKERGLSFTYRYLSDTTGEPFVDTTFGPEDYR
jgi:hypothetical protein